MGTTLPRRRQESTIDHLLELLKLTPVWVGPVLAVVAFVMLRFVAPQLFSHSPRGVVDPGFLVRPMMAAFAWIAAGAVILAWITAEVWKLTNRRLLNLQTGITSIRELSWQEFERLIAEAYRRKGYVVEVRGNCSGDGGVDVVLVRSGEKVLVQCKQWQAFKVGVTTVRELLGVVVSKKATKGVVVTSGSFTPDAKAFAAANSQIELIDGPELAELISQVKRPTTTAPALPLPPLGHTAPEARCPSCGSAMVLRTARKSPNPGSKFWGCVRYPACRGTRPQAD